MDKSVNQGGRREMARLLTDRGTIELCYEAKRICTAEVVTETLGEVETARCALPHCDYG